MLLRKLSMFLVLGVGSMLLSVAQTAKVPNPASTALPYFWAHPSSQGIQQEDVAYLQLSSQHTESGVQHAYYTQTYRGIPIEGAVLQIHLDQSDSLLALSHTLVRKLSSRITALAPAVSPESAVRTLATHLGLPSPTELTPISSAQGTILKQQFQTPELPFEPISLSLSYLPTGPKLALCWQVELPSIDGAHHWQAWIDVLDSRIHLVRDAVIHCEFEPDAFARMHEDECEEGHGLHTMNWGEQHQHTVDDGSSYRVYAYPVESPNHGQPSLVSSPADSLASPFGWHDIDGIPGPEYTQTRGNNVWAQEDRRARNDATGFSPDGGLGLDFDFPFDSSLTPVAPVNQAAAITNLFYWNNLTHDIIYHYGFDEAAGNFQTNNYGRGGIGGDFIFADAQDGSGTNNANFSTPIDGDNPRMQMFLWNVTDFLLTIDAPTVVAGTYEGALSTYGPLLDTAVVGELVLVEDPTGTHLACDTILNSPDLSGKIVMVDRGGCFFSDKIRKVQSFGAIAVIIVQDQPGPPFPMVGNSSNIVIPSIMITQALGNQIKAAMSQQPVTATLLDQGPATGLDSDLDAGIVIHEYGHGISIRLTGGAGVNRCLVNEEQAGEGWSDWYGLALTHRPGDTRDQPRGIATYVQGQDVTDRGIRTYPYSTDMSINPMTYEDIKTLSVPHGVGSVMATMLWDLYWDLVDTYGFDPDLIHGTGGNQIAIQLVTDGLKLQPCQPGFVDVRDAILLADVINNNGANQCLIWQAFARRGLGYSADQGSSSSRSDGTSAFDLPPQCRDTLFLDKNTPTLLASRGDTLVYEFITVNRTGSLLTDVTIRDTLPEGLRFVGGLEGCPVTHEAGVIQVNWGPTPNMFQDTCKVAVAVESDAPQSAQISLNTLEDPADTVGFQSISLEGNDGWQYVSEGARSGSRAFFVPNVGALNDQILRLPKLTPQDGTILSFWHRYDTELGFDGGWVEFKIPGSEWIDLEPFFVRNGYNAGVASNNPVGAHPAFGGDSEGYIESWIDLSIFATTEMDIRFRFVSDNNTFSRGWWIDDIGLLQSEEITNSACVTAAQGNTYCAEQPQPIYIVPRSATNISPVATSVPVAQVYPNPARNYVDVELSDWPSGPISLRLESILGATIQTRMLPTVPKERIRFEWSDLPAGVYFLRIQHAQHQFTQRLFIHP